MQQFKVGDKVQIKAPWSSDFTYGIVVEVRGDHLESDWVCKDDGSVHRACYETHRHYLLEPKKKGLCMFLDKVQKEYSK